MRKSQLLYPLILLSCWTGLIGAGTYALIETTLRQHFARRFPSTEGRIIRSEVGHSIVIRRGIDIEYNYSVGGVDYTGHRFRYDDHNATLEWDTAVDDHPRWSAQKVYYNPDNPADAILEPGVDGADLLLLLFALPLDVLTVTLWRPMIGQLRKKDCLPAAGGVRIFKGPNRTRVALEETSPWTAGFSAMAIVAFVAAFPAVIMGGFMPPRSMMKTSWYLVLGAGLAVFLWRLARKCSGVYDLQIDKSGQTILLPQTAGRQQTISIARSEISGVTLQRRVTTGPSGMHWSYLPTLNHQKQPAEPDAIKLVTWGWPEEKARAFSQWLSEELGVQFKGIEEESPDLAAKS